MISPPVASLAHGGGTQLVRGPPTRYGVARRTRNTDTSEQLASSPPFEFRPAALLPPLDFPLQPPQNVGDGSLASIWRGWCNGTLTASLILGSIVLWTWTSSSWVATFHLSIWPHPPNDIAPCRPHGPSHWVSPSSSAPSPTSSKPYPLPLASLLRLLRPTSRHLHLRRPRLQKPGQVKDRQSL